MDAFPMIARCAARQTNVTHSIWPILGPSYCVTCGEIKWQFYKLCSLCAIREAIAFQEKYDPQAA